jgi:myo-inositol-1(or 4)-monophosphatase
MFESNANEPHRVTIGQSELQRPISYETLNKLSAAAHEAAQAAGRCQMDRFGKNGQRILDNPAHDLKIAMDRASETAICTILQSAFPDHAILSEEGGLMGSTADFTWIIDPLDGTLNYFNGMPFFCTSVACYHTPLASHTDIPDARVSAVSHGKPLVGVVYAPYLDWLFSAKVGHGATFNGQPIRKPSSVALKDAVISISFGSHETVMGRMQTVVAALLQKTKKLRMIGATALELAQLAKGSTAGLVRLNIKIWDFAAAALILTECGVQCEVWPNVMNGWQILAARHDIFQPLKSILNACSPEDFYLSS